MSMLYTWLKSLIRSERGQDMVEYALIAVVISIAIVGAVALLLEPGFQAWANDVCGEVSGSACPVVGG